MYGGFGVRDYGDSDGLVSAKPYSTLRIQDLMTWRMGLTMLLWCGIGMSYTGNWGWTEGS